MAQHIMELGSSPTLTATATAAVISDAANRTMANASAGALSTGLEATGPSSGHFILVVLKVIPGALYWLITFVSITLPTWLFTLFSTSLTFTMNFTTL